MKQFLKPLLVILLSFTLKAIIAQTFNLKFAHFTTKQGLLSNTIWEIKQDSLGYIWILQEGGISRYDGINFRNYDTFEGDEDYNKIESAFNLFIDKNGQVWAFESSGVFLKYSRERDAFVLYDYFEIQGNPDPVSHFFESKKGILWYADRDLLYHDPTNRQFVLYKFKNKLLDSLTITSICEDNYNNLWVSTIEGPICKIETETGEEIIYKSDQWLNNANKLYFDSEETMWLLNNHSIGTIDLNTMKYKKKYDGFFFNECRNIFEDSKSNLWFAAEGLLYYDRQEGVFRNFKHNKGDYSSISSNIIQALYIDKNGGLWVGNDIEGIDHCKLDDNIAFKLYQKKHGNPSSLICDTITALANSTKSSVWVGTYNGLDKLNLSSQAYKHYLKDKCIYKVYEDKSGNLWVIIAQKDDQLNNQLLLRESGSKEFKTVDIGKDGEYNVNSFTPTSIFETSQNRILIGGKKLYWFNQEIMALEPIVNGAEIIEEKTNDNNELFITSMVEDANGNILILVSNCYNYSQLFALQNINQTILPSNIDAHGAWRLTFENKNRIWLIGSNDIAYIDTLDALKPHNAKIFDLSAIPSIRNAFSLFSDKKGNFWFGTNNGLYKLNLKKNNYSYFDIENGMPHRYIGYSTDFIRDFSPSLKTESNELIFGTPNGLICFDPESIRDNLNPPTVDIIDFRIFNKSVPIGMNNKDGNFLEQSISSTKHITLSYKERDFSFEFIALDLANPLNNQYAYILEGFDQEWKYTDGRNRIANFSNVPGGDYTFRVKASNNHGVWNETGTSIDITIIPPIWKTNWFKLLSSILLISFISMYVRNRMYAVRKRNKELEKLVKKRTTKIITQNEELKAQSENLKKLNEEVKEANQAKLKFFTNVSHELRTPLTLIIGPLENLIANKKVEPWITKQHLLVHRNSRRLMELINQLMDFRKLDAGYLKLKVRHQDIIEFLHQIFFSFSCISQNSNIKYIFNCDIEKLHIWYDADKIEKIVSNLLSNAFKYTPKNGRIIFECKVLEKEEALAIFPGYQTSFNGNSTCFMFSVSDTGPGIPESKINKIFDRFYRVSEYSHKTEQGSGIGLALSKKLVELHKGAISVKSLVKKTEFQISDSEKEFTRDNSQISTTFTVILPTGKENFIPEEISSENENSKYSLLSQLEFKVSDFDKKINHQLSEVKKQLPENAPKILIVEDNPDVREYVTSILGNENHIEQSINGKDGLNKAFETHFDLIISDVMMPEMDGMEFCKLIKTNIKTSHIPVILLTAKSSVDDQLSGYTIGADDYITKPFNEQMLISRVNNLIESRKIIREKFRKQIVFNPETLTQNTIDKKILKKASEVVEKNISNSEFNISIFAKELGMSERQLHRKLKSLTDQTPNSFITNIRLKKAARLILENELQFAEIAYQVGFSVPSYFSSSFKKHFGVSPTDFLKQEIESI